LRGGRLSRCSAVGAIGQRHRRSAPRDVLSLEDAVSRRVSAPLDSTMAGLYLRRVARRPPPRSRRACHVGEGNGSGRRRRSPARSSAPPAAQMAGMFLSSLPLVMARLVGLGKGASDGKLGGHDRARRSHAWLAGQAQKAAAILVMVCENMLRGHDASAGRRLRTLSQLSGGTGGGCSPQAGRGSNRRDVPGWTTLSLPTGRSARLLLSPDVD